MTRLVGEQNWTCDRDEEGHREYKLTSTIAATVLEGPANVLLTPGLPMPGAPWLFFNDYDPWAFCRRDAKIMKLPGYGDNEPAEFYQVVQTFSSKPVNKCQDDKVENPLLMPPEISGSYIKHKEEIAYDVFGRPVVNSAWEQFRGHQVEFDISRPKVKVKKNVPFNNIPMIGSMVNTLNDRLLWGLPSRCVKFTDWAWERKFYGQCFPYYVHEYEFELDIRTFDRLLLDEGTKCLQGHWSGPDGGWVVEDIAGEPPDKNNPAHFKRAVDRENNAMRVVLDGNGRPYDPRGFCSCFFGTRTQAQREQGRLGASTMIGPYGSSGECQGWCPGTGNNPYIANWGIPDTERDEMYWCITAFLTDPSLQGGVTTHTECFFGTAAQGAEYVTNTLLETYDIAVSTGPFTTKTACEEVCTGSSETEAWWLLASSGTQPGKRPLIVYRSSNFNALGLPLSL